VFCDDRTKRPAADNDDIEVTRSSRDRLVSAVARFLQRVAKEAPHIVEREGGEFRR
jgi:hypothetical protein